STLSLHDALPIYRLGSGAASHQTDQAAIAAPTVSGYSIQVCGTNGTVRHTLSHVRNGAEPPPTSNATSKTASAASAPNKHMVRTAPGAPASAYPGRSRTGRPGECIE